MNSTSTPPTRGKSGLMMDTRNMSSSFVCDVCGEGFETPSALGGHKTSHPLKSEEEIKLQLRELSEELGHPPSTTDIKESTRLSIKEFYRVFESHKEGVKAAGLNPDEAPSRWDVRGQATRDELLSEIGRLTEMLGRPPKRSDIRQHSDVSPRPFYRVFGTWGDALRAAGHEPEKRWSISEQELIEEIQRMADELGRPPKYEEMNEFGEYSASTYESQFGSWKNGVESAGFEPVSMPTGEDNPNWDGGHRRTERYGEGWTETLKARVRERDGFTCRDPDCVMGQEEHLRVYNQKLHVHHIRNPCDFDDSSEAHEMDNLITFCHYHHLSKWEKLQPFVPKVIK